MKVNMASVRSLVGWNSAARLARVYNRRLLGRVKMARIDFSFMKGGYKRKKYTLK